MRQLTHTVTPGRRIRRGFTVVELVVTMLVLSVGVLGLATSSVVLSRQISGARQQTVAAALAQSRFEQLRSMRCTAIDGGSATARGVTETWTAQDTARAVIVVDSVKWTERGQQRAHAYRSMIPCPENL